MNNYHIVYYDNKEDLYSKGITIQEENELKALIKFKKDFPNSLFAVLYKKE